MEFIEGAWAAYTKQTAGAASNTDSDKADDNGQERLQAVLDALSSAITLSEEDLAIRQQVCDTLQHILKEQHFGGRDCQFSILQYGSAPGGLGMPGSDLDLGLGGLVCNVNDWLGAPRDSIKQQQKQYTQVDDLQSFQRKNLLHRLADFIEHQGICDSYGVDRVMDAKVPIIKFYDAQTGLSVDICCGVKGRRIKHQVCYQLGRLCPLFPKLYRLVKLWARVHTINNAVEGTFNSWTLTLMTIFSMQVAQSQLLPPLQTLCAGPLPSSSPPTQQLGGQAVTQAAGVASKTACCPAAIQVDTHTTLPGTPAAGKKATSQPSSPESPPLYQPASETNQHKLLRTTAASLASSDPLPAFPQLALTDGNDQSLSDYDIQEQADAGLDESDTAAADQQPPAGGPAYAKRLLEIPMASEDEQQHIVDLCTQWVDQHLANSNKDSNDAWTLLHCFHWFITLFSHLSTEVWSQHCNSGIRVSPWLGQLYRRFWPHLYLVSIEEPFDADDNTARSIGTSKFSNTGTLHYIQHVLSKSLELLNKARDSNSIADACAAFIWLWGDEGLLSLPSKLHADSLQGLCINPDALAKAWEMYEEQHPPADIHRMLAESAGVSAGPLTFKQWMEKNQQDVASWWQQTAHQRQKEQEKAADFWAKRGYKT